MEQILLIIGCAIFGILGTIHLVYTFCTRKLHPKDSSAIDAMKKSNLTLTNQTTVWDAWIGFNASHSLGAMVFAAIYIPLCVSSFATIEQSWWLSGLPVIVGASYLALAKRYWFNIPFIGILVSCICFVGAAILIAT